MNALSTLAAALLGTTLSVTPPGSGSLQALTVYDGSWTVSPRPALGETAKVDHLTNHCHMTDAFYTCEQVVNGKPAALLVFTAGSVPGSYHSTVVLPDGSPGGRPGELTIAGDHWTFLNKDENGKPTFRVENVIRDHDHIHYEQYKTTAQGGWELVGQGDEVRSSSL